MLGLLLTSAVRSEEGLIRSRDGVYHPGAPSSCRGEPRFVDLELLGLMGQVHPKVCFLSIQACPNSLASACFSSLGVFHAPWEFTLLSLHPLGSIFLGNRQYSQGPYKGSSRSLHGDTASVPMCSPCMRGSRSLPFLPSVTFKELKIPGGTP